MLNRRPAAQQWLRAARDSHSRRASWRVGRDARPRMNRASSVVLSSLAIATCCVPSSRDGTSDASKKRAHIASGGSIHVRGSLPPFRDVLRRITRNPHARFRVCAAAELILAQMPDVVGSAPPRDYADAMDLPRVPEGSSAHRATAASRPRVSVSCLPPADEVRSGTEEDEASSTER
jgi:hypothetical protein